MIYVPEDSYYNKCYVVQSEGVIRGYNIVPANNRTYSYRDYYINSDYIYRDGTATFSQYGSLPICLPSDQITNNFYYRLDIDKILICFFIIVFFNYYIISSLVKRFFRGRKLF